MLHCAFKNTLALCEGQLLTTRTLSYILWGLLRRQIFMLIIVPIFLTFRELQHIFSVPKFKKSSFSGTVELDL